MPYGFDVVDKGEDVGEVLIYGAIADEKWYDTDVTPKDFKDEMDKLKGKKTINVFINSGGGGVFPGLAIHNILKRSQATVVGFVDGIAASIASVILQGCKKRVVTKDSLVMIHNPAAAVWGDAEDMRKAADALDKCKDSIVSTYKERVDTSEEEIRSMMDAETWMTGEEAVAFGFADVLEEGKGYTASLGENGKAIINGKEVEIGKFSAFPTDKLPKKVEKTSENKPEIVVNFSIFEAQIALNSNSL